MSVQPVREEAACQLAFAMEESQKGYSAPQTDAAAQQMLGKEGVKGLKKAEQALRKCSPLTASLRFVSPFTPDTSAQHMFLYPQTLQEAVQHGIG